MNCSLKSLYKTGSSLRVTQSIEGRSGTAASNDTFNKNSFINIKEAIVFFNKKTVKPKIILLK